MIEWGFEIYLCQKGEFLWEIQYLKEKYKELLEWKENRSEKAALLIKGARRVGKSTIAEECEEPC